MRLRIDFYCLGLIVCLVASAASEAAMSGEIDGALSTDDRIINGVVLLAGNFTKPIPLPVFKSRTFCGPSVPNETLLVSTEGGLRNAVVLLRPRAGKSVVRPGNLTLDNWRCAFTPHVQVAAVGSAVLLKNSDPILHTVHARLGRETLFNVGLPHWRQVEARLERPGVVRITCDVLHTWMSAAIVVADTPYAAVTDARGHFSFNDLPLGAYDLEVWHERLGTRRQQVHLGAGGSIGVEVIYSSEKIR
ncbi:MAG: hypothetical protein ACREQO_22660 [Candidatus Binatia bacterium]